MTPKEKAKELMQKYDFVHIEHYTSEREVKYCALIAVNNIIDSLQIKNYPQADQYEYWNEVKTEIEKL